jgi:acetyl-CoA C-acetyltransferase
MLEGIHFAGSVRTPFGSFCGAFADVSAVEVGKAPVERSRREAAGRQRKLLVGHILSGALRPNAECQILIEAGFVGGGMAIAIGLELIEPVGRFGPPNRATRSSKNQT